MVVEINFKNRTVLIFLLQRLVGQILSLQLTVHSLEKLQIYTLDMHFLTPCYSLALIILIEHSHIFECGYSIAVFFFFALRPHLTLAVRHHPYRTKLGALYSATTLVSPPQHQINARQLIFVLLSTILSQHAQILFSNNHVHLRVCVGEVKLFP